MASAKRILALGTSARAGDWPPLAAVTVGLHQAGHAVRCFGDSPIARDFASAGLAIQVVPSEAAFPPVGGGLRPLQAWAESCWPEVCALIRDFRPQGVVSQLFTAEVARRIKAVCGLRWCCINPAYYFGPDSLRPFEADFAAPLQPKKDQRQGVGEADLVLHATDEIFDPPPPSLPPHHHYVGPLMWERSSEVPAYLDVSGDPWVLVSLSSWPQAQEEQIPLAYTTLRTLADVPVRVVVTFSAGPPREQIGPVPPNARLERFVPHSQVLPRSRLLVSQAGHGVVAKALYYGVPMVLIPWGSDQPGVAARAAALGVAEVVARQDITEQRLAAAIHKVLGTPRYHENATQIASRMQTRDAVATARARIEALLATT